jgi:hypothetical protein
LIVAVVLRPLGAAAGLDGRNQAVDRSPAKERCSLKSTPDWLRDQFTMP